MKRCTQCGLVLNNNVTQCYQCKIPLCDPAASKAKSRGGGGNTYGSLATFVFFAVVLGGAFLILWTCELSNSTVIIILFIVLSLLTSTGGRPPGKSNHNVPFPF